MQLHKVKGDGNCCITAAWWALTGKDGPADIKTARRWAQQYIDERLHEFKGTAEDEAKEDTAEQPRRWGGQHELLAISALADGEIYVFNIQAPAMTINHYGEQDGHTERVYLVYTGGHYDALCLADGTRRFAVTDIKALNAARERADDLHQQRPRPLSQQPTSSANSRRRRRRSSTSSDGSNSSSSSSSNKENKRPSPSAPRPRKKRCWKGGIRANASAASSSPSPSTEAAARERERERERDCHC
jgi:OTU-like cysteine protease